MIVPVFVFDSREKWFPVGVEEALAATGAWERASDGRKGVNAWLSDTRLDFPSNMTQPDLPPVGYHRMQRGGGLFWHQWWLFYLYNPWSVAGVGKHEGDWEFVQTGCIDEAGDRPVLVTCSQHHDGEGVAIFPENDGTYEELRVYVALGSHATYFTPGRIRTDRCNGNGKQLGAGEDEDHLGWRESIEWRPFGAWASWPGRWGNSDNSPQSPARQGHRWSAPHLFHSSAR